MNVVEKVPSTTSELVETENRRVVSLDALGFPEVPILGLNRAARTEDGSAYHRHAGCMEITLCVRGSVKFDCGERVYVLLPGKVFASCPQDVHRLRLNQKGAVLYWIFLKLPRRGETFLGLSKEETAHVVKMLTTLPNRLFAVATNLQDVFEELFAAYDGRDQSAVARRFGVRVSMLKLVSELVTCGHRAGDVSGDSAMMRLIERMGRHPEEHYETDRLVAEMHLSPNTILKRFRALTGLPPHAFHMRCRIRRACEMLCETNMSIVEIAVALGFSSPQHLATRFMEEIGMTPTEWRLSNPRKKGTRK